MTLVGHCRSNSMHSIPSTPGMATLCKIEEINEAQESPVVCRHIRPDENVNATTLFTSVVNINLLNHGIPSINQSDGVSSTKLKEKVLPKNPNRFERLFTFDGSSVYRVLYHQCIV